MILMLTSLGIYLFGVASGVLGLLFIAASRMEEDDGG